jgi:hypothetical protein
VRDLGIVASIPSQDAFQPGARFKKNEQLAWPAVWFSTWLHAPATCAVIPENRFPVFGLVKENTLCWIQPPP